MTRRLKRILYSMCVCLALGYLFGLWSGYAIWHNPAPVVTEQIDVVSIDNEEFDELDDVASVDSVSADYVASDYDSYLDTMPEDNMVKLHVRPIGGALGKVFNDSNGLHIQAALQIGIEPINSPADAWYVKRPLVRIRSNSRYVVGQLSHSLPYLVPEAANLLDDIGARFADSLQSRGGGDYRIKVTSVLRTPATVKRLRRINRNASARSAHQYGTTFDISYVNFACGASTGRNRTQADLKNLLGEILNDLRNEQRCYVKYERRQGCFHITVRES